MRTPPLPAIAALALALLLVVGCTDASDARLTAPECPLPSSHTCELEVSLADGHAEIAALGAEVDALETYPVEP